MPSNRATIYIPDNIRRVIGKTDQGELSSRIAEICDRYGEIMKRADRELEDALTEAEIFVVASVIQGTLWQPASLIDGGIAADLADAEDDYFASKDARKALIAKVHALTFAQQVALVERTRRLMRRSDK